MLCNLIKLWSHFHIVRLFYTLEVEYGEGKKGEVRVGEGRRPRHLFSPPPILVSFSSFSPCLLFKALYFYSIFHYITRISPLLLLCPLPHFFPSLPPTRLQSIIFFSFPILPSPSPSSSPSPHLKGVNILHSLSWSFLQFHVVKCSLNMSS